MKGGKTYTKSILNFSTNEDFNLPKYVNQDVGGFFKIMTLACINPWVIDLVNIYIKYLWYCSTVIVWVLLLNIL